MGAGLQNPRKLSADDGEILRIKILRHTVTPAELLSSEWEDTWISGMKDKIVFIGRCNRFIPPMSVVFIDAGGTDFDAVNVGWGIPYVDGTGVFHGIVGFGIEHYPDWDAGSIIIAFIVYEE